MRFSTIKLLCLVLFSSIAIEAKANFVTNGDFENSAATYPFQTFTVGNTTGITGWTVISGINDPGQGSVDLYHGLYAYSGNQAVDLDGTGPPAAGGLSQNVTGLTAGSSYTLTFFYANNPNGTGSSALVTIGDLSQTVSHSTSTSSSMDYNEATFTFTATNSLLSFASLDSANDEYGIILDDVSIVATTSSVPEPASCAMLGLGLASIVGFARLRGRTHPASTKS